jgi:hypothetical protein
MPAQGAPAIGTAPAAGGEPGGDWKISVASAPASGTGAGAEGAAHGAPGMGSAAGRCPLPAAARGNGVAGAGTPVNTGIACVACLTFFAGAPWNGKGARSGEGSAGPVVSPMLGPVWGGGGAALGGRGGADSAMRRATSS